MLNTANLFSISLFILFVAASCRTVPESAPTEFHEAHAAIEKAKNEDVDNNFPQTIERAETEFDSSLSLWKDVADKEVTDETDEQLLTAVSDADDVRLLVEGVTDLNQDIKKWDSKSSELAAGELLERPMVGLRDVNEAVVIVEPIAIKSPFAMLGDVKIQRTVAFFDTAKSDLDPYYHSAIDDVAAILSKDDSLEVTITGYADPRGPKIYNRELSLARAMAVARQLGERGVTKGRLRTVAMGSKIAHFNDGTDKLQLERRVDITLAPSSK